jgi:uroporphyrinogen decarboxylase
MTSKERVKLTLQHQEPDRIPLDFGATLITGIHVNAYKNLLQYLGIEKTEFPIMFERPQNAIIHDDVLDRFKVDVRGLIPHEARRIRREDEQYDYYTDEWGVTWRKAKNGGKYFDIVGNPLPATDISIDDLKTFPWPNLADPARLQGLKARAQEIKSLTGCALVLEGIIGSEIFDGSFYIRGFENFYLDLAGNPDAACYLMDKMLELQLQYWEMALQEVGDEVLIVRVGDDLGEQTRTRISPRMYRKFVKSRHAKLFSSLRKMTNNELYIFLHSDGAIAKIIPDLIEIGVDILNPIQYTATGMDTKSLKQEFGKDLTFWGGVIDPQGTLPHGTPQQVKDEVKRHIDDLAPGGGFVFCQVHNYQDDIPPQNIMAVYEALDEYGGR